MQGFLETVIKGLVDHPEDVRISAQERGGTTIYEVRLHADDMGKIIGRQGATIHAIRSLLQVGSAKKGVRCLLELIDEEETGERAR